MDVGTLTVSKAREAAKLYPPHPAAYPFAFLQEASLFPVAAVELDPWLFESVELVVEGVVFQEEVDMERDQHELGSLSTRD